jgi:RimJ/RimL family protein N-acetyltransferase
MPDDLAAPILTTPHLRLRPPEARDFEPLAEMLADPELMRFLGGAPADREQSWRMLAFMVGHWRLRGYGLFAVEERDTGRLVARVGLLDPEGWPGTELAWTVARPFWGRGYAVEAARAVLGHAARDLRLPPLISLIDPANTRSIRVAEKLGAAVERRIPFKGVEVDVWRHRLSR